MLREASYSLTYGERGSGVAFVASEPITGSNTDWVSVPKNTALVITREKGGYINIMRSPLLAAPPGPGRGLIDPVQQEVAICLEVRAPRVACLQLNGWEGTLGGGCVAEGALRRAERRGPCSRRWQSAWRCAPEQG